MLNPFEELVSEDKFEEVEGHFDCQRQGCYTTNVTAKYLAKAKYLTWDCPEGHTNKIRDFKID